MFGSHSDEETIAKFRELTKVTTKKAPKKSGGKPKTKTKKA